jgi:predicted MFS family arabinose efflux permease
MVATVVGAFGSLNGRPAIATSTAAGPERSTRSKTAATSSSSVAQPPEWRRTTASMIYAALPGGALVGALGSAKLVSAFGWRGVFVASAVLLGAIALLVVALLREAPPDEGERQVDEKRPIQALFTDGRGSLTLALWGFFLFVGPGLILLGLWMPNLLQLMGSTPAQASLIAACLNVGAVLSSFVVGWLIKRYSILLVFGVMLVIGAASWPVMIVVHHDFSILLAVVFVAGWTMGGVITGGVALAATSHPTSMQATSIGSAVAVTRVGQVIAPLAIGMLLGAGATPSFTMLMCGTPTIAAFLVLIVLNRLSPRTSAVA